MEDLKEKESAGGEKVELEESSLEAIVTCWLKRISHDAILDAIEAETRHYGCELPLNSGDVVGKKLWGGITDEHYREVFLSIVKMFVCWNKELVKKMMDGEFKTRWDYMGGR